MSEFFLKVLNLSISATWLVLAILAARLLLKKAPKWVSVLLWGLVALRLVVPFSLESTFSLIPSTEVIGPEIMIDATPEIHTGIESLNRVINPIITETFAPNPATSANPLQILIPVAAVIWCIGMVLMLGYTLLSYWRLRWKLRTAILLRGNVYHSDQIPTPFVLGIFRPRIYLPTHTDPQDIPNVIAHERSHIRRHDHWWKPLGFTLLSVHWFNPAMWIAYILLCRDIELACDEKVVKEMPPAQRADYSQSLLNCSITHRSISACPLAFGEVGVKQRVRNVLSYKKPAFWVLLLCILLCTALAATFLTDPKQPLETLVGKTFRLTDVVYADPRYSSIYVIENEDNAYAITKDITLMATNENDSQNIWNKLGQLEVIELTERNFDDLFFDISNPSPASIRKHTVHSFRTTHNSGFDTRLYYFLQLDDGTLYLAHGYENEDYTLIRWLFRLESVPELDQLPDWGISAVAEDVTPIGATFRFVMENVTEGEFIYGDDYCLQRLENGIWVDLEPLQEPVFFTIGYTLGPNHAYYHEWDDIYGTLPIGHYRFGKTVTRQLSPSKNQSLTVWAEFDLPQPDTGPIPLENIPANYTLEQAEIDGCVVFVEGDIRFGQDIWDLFVDAAQQGRTAFVRLVERHSDTTFVSDLSYDGNIFTLTSIQNGQPYTQRYSYLRYFTGGPEEFPGAEHDIWNSYVLTNNTSATRKELYDSLLSSQAGVAIDFTPVYSDYIFFPDHPTLLDSYEKITLELEGQILMTITDIPTMTVLRDLIIEAEALGYEPKTYSLGLDLVFADENGNTKTVSLDIENDLCVVDGLFYDYGPGYTDVGSIDGRPMLWEALGLTDWPQELYDWLDAIWAAHNAASSQMPSPADLRDIYNKHVSGYLSAMYYLYNDGTVVTLWEEDRDTIQSLLLDAEIQGGELWVDEETIQYKIAITNAADDNTVCLWYWGDDANFALDTGDGFCLVIHPDLKEAISTALSNATK